jgi:hypothetical protein
MKADSAPPRSLFPEGETPSPTLDQAKARAVKAGWDCQAREGADGVELYNCGVAVEQPGFVRNIALQAAIGYHVTPRVYVAVTGRLQVDGRGKGTLPGILVGGRLGYQLTKPSEDGFIASLFIGGGAGQIQVQPPASTAGAKGPYVASGLGAAQLGTSLGYRFNRYVGLAFIPQANFMLPTFLFDLDINGSVQLSF